jgi:translation initiation factor IF-1
MRAELGFFEAEVEDDKEWSRQAKKMKDKMKMKIWIRENDVEEEQ